MKTLLLIPSKLKKDVEPAVTSDRHPVLDYYALLEELRKSPGDTADILDFGALESSKNPFVSLVSRLAGRDAGLAVLGFLRSRQYDAIFTNSESVGIPLALLFKFRRRRPRHVTIGHRLSSGKKQIFFQRLRVHNQIDTIFVYAALQKTYVETKLGVPYSKVKQIAFHADDRFYRPLSEKMVDEHQICSAGLEWRDYPTLIAAVADMPDLKVKLAAASPWSKHTNETENRVLPSHVNARRYEYNDLRDLYAMSSFVVVPLYEVDFQAGVTTLLEAMAMGKAVIVTRTTGQTDVVVDGENGLTVAPGDAAGLRATIQRLRDDRDLRARLGANARAWLEANASLDRWVQEIVGAIRATPATLRH